MKDEAFYMAEEFQRMKNKYADLGIDPSQRRNYKLIMVSFFFSVIDCFKLIFLYISGKSKEFDNIVVAPEVSVKVKGSYAYIPKFESVFESNKAIVISRSVRGGRVLKADNYFDLTAYYVLGILLSSLLGLFFRSKNNIKISRVIKWMKWLSEVLLANKEALYVSDWNNPFSGGFILASKSLGIKSFELQHGVVHSKHPAYSSENPSIGKLSCDYLYYWYLPKNREFLSLTYPESAQIDINYNINKGEEGVNRDVLLITLQDSNCSEFVKAIAPLLNSSLTDNYRCIIKPRRQLGKAVQSFLEGFDKVNISYDDFYSLLREAKIHISHSSTTLIESCFLRGSNISFDYDDNAGHRNDVIFDLVEQGLCKKITTVDSLQKYLLYVD